MAVPHGSEMALGTCAGAAELGFFRKSVTKKKKKCVCAGEGKFLYSSSWLLQVQEAENTCVHSGGPEKPKLAWYAGLTCGRPGYQIRVICWGRKFHHWLTSGSSIYCWI